MRQDMIIDHCVLHSDNLVLARQQGLTLNIEIFLIYTRLGTGEWGAEEEDAPAGGRAAHAARDLRDHVLVQPLLDAYAQSTREQYRTGVCTLLVQYVPF